MPRQQPDERRAVLAGIILFRRLSAQFGQALRTECLVQLRDLFLPGIFRVFPRMFFHVFSQARLKDRVDIHQINHFLPPL